MSRECHFFHLVANFWNKSWRLSLVRSSARGPFAFSSHRYQPTSSKESGSDHTSGLQLGEDPSHLEPSGSLNGRDKRIARRGYNIGDEV